jgi:hypothetical protein
MPTEHVDISGQVVESPIIARYQGVAIDADLLVGAEKCTSKCFPPYPE